MPLTSPENWHRKNHPWPAGVSFEDCWRCQKQRARCREKRRYETPVAADEVVDEIRSSEMYIRPIGRYHCRWCAG